MGEVTYRVTHSHMVTCQSLPQPPYGPRSALEAVMKHLVTWEGGKNCGPVAVVLVTALPGGDTSCLSLPAAISSELHKISPAPLCLSPSDSHESRIFNMPWQKWPPPVPAPQS